jgi:hypothetical protein
MVSLLEATKTSVYPDPPDGGEKNDDAGDNGPPPVATNHSQAQPDSGPSVEYRLIRVGSLWMFGSGN